MLFGLLGSRKHPKGPSFKRARKLEYDYSGNKLSFKAPSHTMTGFSGLLGKSKVDIYRGIDYGRLDVDKKQHSYALQNSYREDWAFEGIPVFQGRLGWMSLSLTILASNTSSTLFNKSIFEKVIIKYIDDNYGPNSVDEPWNLIDRYVAPLNWGVVSINGLDWLSYEMKEKKSYEEKLVYSIPITNMHFVVLCFTKTEYFINKFCQKVFEAHIQNILNTLILELSPESQRQKAEVEKQYPNQQYSDFQPVFEWPEFETLKPEEDEFAKAYREVRQSIDGFEA